MLYENIREESLKLKVAADWFPKFDCTDLIGRIDFAVKARGHAPLSENKKATSTDTEYILWAEAKQQPTDIYRMLAQLIITIKADAFDRVPPKFIGCFDNEKIAFIEYHYALHIYQINDFNWTQTPSAVDDKTIETVRNAIDPNRVFTFYFDSDSLELKNFIKANFAIDGGSMLATLIDKNNFIFVYQKWLKLVMPKINADWALLKSKYNIYDRDFFLAELNIDDNGTVELSDDKTINDDFYVTFNASDPKPYELKRKDGFGLEVSYRFGFKSDGLQQYTDFWKRYKRPPENEYWDYILDRLDLLVPQDVRERKGAYFTPQIWVEKSQQYIADVLGDNWQDEYYVWDCCAGTGNLLNGLTNKYNVWASTLDQQDVDVMKDRIRNGANLLENHVFQFDFLNDDFLPNDGDNGRDVARNVATNGKLPRSLYDIITDPEKRKKLVIYINPPYAEAANKRTVVGKGMNRDGVAISKVREKYINDVGSSINELFVQFLLRTYKELPSCKLAQFSTLKALCAPNFAKFRNVFQAKLKQMFVVPANTFDNVTGQFPIGFFIWDIGEKDVFSETMTDVYDSEGNQLENKTLSAVTNSNTINKWIRLFFDSNSEIINWLCFVPNDFQHNNGVFFTQQPSESLIRESRVAAITKNNFLQMCIYLAVRHCIKATWLNDRDQFLYPNDGWKTDAEFQTNCLIYTLFHGQNRISASQGTNHWIPFTEAEVDAKDRFESHFMSDFLAGKIKPQQNETDLFSSSANTDNGACPIVIGVEAQSVMDAGRELWRYYHTMADANPNASLYDIKEYFQGRNDKGKMNPSSEDAHYTELLDNLKSALKALGEQIKPKVYEYGFLR